MKKKSVSKPVKKEGTKKAEKAENKKKHSSLYQGTTQDLFNYARLGWNNYLAHLPKFAAFSPRFTVKMAEEELKFIDKTEKLPNNQKLLREIRLDLLEDNAVVTDLFRSGIWYIEEAFPNTAVRKNKLQAAGLPHFKGALAFDWEKTANLIADFKTFLASNKKTLTANDIMPATFIKSFTTAADRFLETKENNRLANEVAAGGGNSRMADLNKIYTALSRMTGTGSQVIFKNKPELRKKFIIQELLDEVRLTRKSRLSGYARIEGSKKSVSNAVVSILNLPAMTTKTDRKGKYVFELEPGTYSIKIKAPGYQIMMADKKVEIGAKARLSFWLKPVTATDSNLPPLPTETPKQKLSNKAEPAPVKAVKKTVSNGVKV